MNIKLVFILLLSALVSSCYDVGVEHEAQEIPETVIPEMQGAQKFIGPSEKPAGPSEKEDLAVGVSFFQAEAFFRARCKNLGHQYIQGKIVRDYELNANLYVFLSAPQAGYLCIAVISDRALELLTADCGAEERKLEEWINGKYY